MQTAFEHGTSDLERRKIIDYLRISDEFEGESSPGAHQDALNAFIGLHRSGLSEAELLKAHGTLMSNRDTCEEGEKGVYRYQRVRVGNRLMPLASLVPDMTRRLITHADTMPSEKVADILVKIHPFADGNGRMARIVLAHLNLTRHEELVPFTGAHALHEQVNLTNWLEDKYPECDVACELIDDVPAASHNWHGIITREMRS